MKASQASKLCYSAGFVCLETSHHPRDWVGWRTITPDLRQHLLRRTQTLHPLSTQQPTRPQNNHHAQLIPLLLILRKPRQHQKKQQPIKGWPIFSTAVANKKEREALPTFRGTSMGSVKNPIMIMLLKGNPLAFLMQILSKSVMPWTLPFPTNRGRIWGK